MKAREYLWELFAYFTVLMVAGFLISGGFSLLWTPIAFLIALGLVREL